MAFQAYPDGALAILEYGGLSAQWTNTLWFEKLALQSHDYQALADYLHLWSTETVMPNLYDGWALNEVTVYDMSSSIGGKFISSAAPTFGSVAGDPAAINGAMVVTFYSNVRGRNGRGRNYVTGFVEADIGATVVSNATRIANLDAAYTTLITGVQINSPYFWVVASRQIGGVERPNIVGYDVDNVDVRNAVLGSQRRRLDRE